MQIALILWDTTNLVFFRNLSLLTAIFYLPKTNFNCLYTIIYFLFIDYFANVYWPLGSSGVCVFGIYFCMLFFRRFLFIRNSQIWILSLGILVFIKWIITSDLKALELINFLPLFFREKVNE